MKFYVLAMAAATVAAPAFAQNDSTFHGGARIEGRAGWDSVSIGVDGDHGSKSGVSYGGEVGYDAVLSGFVLGAYAGIDGSTVKECIEDVGVERACAKAGRNITAGIRAGGRIGRGLLYVKGGYSKGRITVKYEDLVHPVNNFNEGANGDGFHVGAGYEVNVTDHVYVKGEYVFTKYSVGDDFGSDVDLHRHQVVAGVGFRF